MEGSIVDAKSQFTELLCRAVAGDEIILTRDGCAVAQLVSVNAQPDPRDRKGLLEAVRSSAAAKRGPGGSAARSEDFLYGDGRLTE